MLVLMRCEEIRALEKPSAMDLIMNNVNSLPFIEKMINILQLQKEKVVKYLMKWD